MEILRGHWLLLALIGMLAASCNHPSATTTTSFTGSSCSQGCENWQVCRAGKCECEPRCSEQTACQSDECGGICPCPPDLVQSATGVFVEPAECHDTCASAGWACGELCGSDCGECEPAQTCKLGRCECKAECDGSRCDDGCGGYCPCGDGTVCNARGDCVAPAECHDSCRSQKLSCGDICGETCGACEAEQSCVAGSCREAVSCADCALSLRLVSKKLVAGKLREVTLAVEFAPEEQQPHPRLADFRLTSNRTAVVRAARPGDALLQSRKSLMQFDPWNEPWRHRADGSYQLVVYEATNTELVGSGRVLEVVLALDEWGPMRFALQRREQTFAPSEADGALQASRYDDEVIVTR